MPSRAETKLTPAVKSSVSPAVQRLIDRCSDIDNALARNKAERLHLERQRGSVEHRLSELERTGQLPD